MNVNRGRQRGGSRQLPRNTNWNDPKPKACHFYMRNGHCRFGLDCRYSHEGTTASTLTLPGPGTPFSTRKSLRGQRGSVGPLDEISRLILGQQCFTPSQAEYVFNKALGFLDSGPASIIQKIVTELASERGLRNIVKMVKEDYASTPSDINVMDFWQSCVPFLKVITHQELCSSFVLEKSVETVFSAIYGHLGERALPFFRKVADNLQGSILDRKLEEYESALRAAAAALFMTLNNNQSAPLQDEFTSIVKVLRACHTPGQSYFSRAADIELRKLEGKLQIMEAIPMTQPQNTPTVSYSYQNDFDLPGEMSQYGPRHDNDKVSITDISILPTKDEVMSGSSRIEYLPLRDYDTAAHHLPPGMDRIIDTQFRLLREDTSGQLRDAVNFVIRSLAINPNHIPRNISGTQTIIYKNLRVCRMKVGKQDYNGLQVDISFDQPAQIAKINLHAKSLPDALNSRKQWWEHSKYLQVGSLVCLIDLESEFSFYTVAERLIEEAKERTNSSEEPDDYINRPPENLTSHPGRAYITLKVIDPSSLSGLVREYQRQLSLYNIPNLVLPYMVEFPGLLFASFEPILKVLQTITSAGASSMPFTRLIAPEGYTASSHPVPNITPGKEMLIHVEPPLYLAKNGGISLDLTSITTTPKGPKLTHSVEQPCSVEDLLARTTLDKGQAEALINGLSKELVLIQGPPGTGKSYVGVQLVRALLANTNKLNLGPIVCVTYTNHALDQFLLELLAVGSQQLKIIRLGSRSKAPELTNLSLYSISSTARSTEIEESHMQELKGRRYGIREDLENLCDDVSMVQKWETMKSYLEEKYKRIHDQIFGMKGPDENGYRTVSYQKPWTAMYNWCNLRLLRPSRYLARSPDFHLSRRPVRVLLASEDMSLLNSHERYTLKQYWEDEIRQSLITALAKSMSEFNEIKKKLDNSEKDKRCLQGAHIIGVTTTGLATHAELLRKLNAKVLVCEEAGEVLEAHTLTALLPSIEHAVLIGDHKQLRPHIANYSLSMESREGTRYALDESLFERLTRERYGINKDLQFPYSTLDTQRRMHPSIASLVRETLYPSLKDHEITAHYPEVDGMGRRLFWLNHGHPEANSDKLDPQQLSKSNDFEVEMTTALVKHLIRQGSYGKGDIAVITPYLGQLKKLRNRLSSMVEILVGEKDELALELAEAVESQNLSKEPVASSDLVRKGDLLSQVRVATVDNFQGEEAKVIIVSLVRCNSSGKVGFLKTSNRINVLLSRAKHGMYIIGSAETARSIPMWSDVLTLLAQNYNLGDELQLRCARHPETPIFVNEPEHFLRFSPEGGCDERCGRRLDACEHTCVSKCHSDLLHKAMVCMEKCTRALPGCLHSCVRPCGKPCNKCMVWISEVLLVCGHVSKNVPCHLAQKPATIRCRQMVTKKASGCGHDVSVECHVDVSSPSYRCPTQCGQILPCGHDCLGKCHECNPGRLKDTNAVDKHIACQRVCGRSMNTCQHSCIKKCHRAGQCGLCEKPCEVRCSHSKCSKKCHEACTPCTEPCSWGCQHRGRCQLPCGVPCNILPCSVRCEEQLDCGHTCPSICGEKCPSSKYCQHCASTDILQSVVDFVTLDTYKVIDLERNPIVVLRCGHFFCMDTMDGLMQMSDVYKINSDGQILSQKPQGEWITKGLLFEESMRKFIASSQQTSGRHEPELDELARAF